MLGNLVSIGWWKNNKLHGNSRLYEDGTIKKEGWYNNGVCVEPFHMQSTKYKYFNTEECFIPKH